jgi:hypothetical protein
MTILSTLCIAALAIIIVGSILMSASTYDVKSSGCMIVVVGLLLLIVFGISRALADDSQPKTPSRPTCWAIRKAVQSYGEAEVTAWARSRGVSEREIEYGKRCLK